MWKNNIMWKFFLDVLFPRFCLNCQKEGTYLCEDCFSLIDITEKQYFPFCYCAASYENFIVKKLISQFKYEPYVKELAKPLASLIIAHLLNLNKADSFKNYILIPAPLHKKKMKQRGFNQSAEIAKELSRNLMIPVFDDVLIKIKQTPSQTELKKEERTKNVKGAFFCQKPEIVKERKILLVDDIYTTGSTIEEGRRALKKAGASEVWGVVVAHG